MKKLLTTAFLLLLAIPVRPVYGQTEPALDSFDELALSRTLLNDRQDSLGPIDSRLIEPIEQLADRLMSLNQFDEAHAYLDRAMQIARIEDGLYTEIQRPLLAKKISNFANRGDWEGARESMGHLFWLYTQKSRQVDQALVEDLLNLSRVHLRALAEDDSLFQGYHFRQSAQIRWIALSVAETIWSKTDERLAPIIYEQLRQLHLQTVALWRGGTTSYALRKVAPGSDIMRSRSEVNETFYFSGLGLLNSLYAIYAGGETLNPEGIAMTNVYLADWHILYDEPEAAKQTYGLAYEELLAAGIEVSLVDELFSQPMVIPDAEFYSTVQRAVVAQRNRLVTLGDENSHAYVSFSEWSTALPNVSSPIPNPITSPVTSNVDSNFALFSFSLAGVNKVSRWYRHRFSSTVSMIEQAGLLAHFLVPPPEESLLLAKLNSLTFRPKLVGGEPQQTMAHLMYHLAEDNSVSL